MSKPRVAKKLRHSNYLITINTQKTYSADTPEYDEDSKKFDKIISELLSDIKKFIIIQEDGANFSKKYFEPIICEYAVELGGLQRRLHTHIYIAIAHRTKIHLDENAMKERVKSELGLDSIYYNRRIIYNSSDNIREYLKKQIVVK